ncbi:MAG: PTS system mannose/fructose/sorbose family transporter subunit IID [Lachnospiraceae bacterium]|jgi:fructoselysine and glucoselysine-specific PTS system IID component|nr:PTS system mannose/fructose/sorbose family transporter subunit IID [Lachnospiraceae bacterium]
MKMMTSETKVLNKRDLMKVFWRSFTMEWTWNYERQANLGYGFAMVPILEKLYKDKPEEKAEALQRHLEFFNTTPHVSTLILGISSAMEEQNSTQEDFDTSSINNVKVGLMGPLAGIGDSLLWGTLRIIATGIGTSLALQGNILGPILFLLIFNIPHIILRYICMMGGYKLGAGFLSKMQQGGLMDKVTYGASIVGLMSIGAMIATMVTVNIPLSYGEGDSAIVIGDILNGIIPGIIPLLFTGFIYWLVTKKKMKTTVALLLILVIGIIGSLTGILGA